MYVGGDKTIRNNDFGLRSFTESNFRHNLIKLTGGVNPGKDIHAHHVIPKEFRVQAAAAGINVNDPGNGMWLPKSAHQQAHSQRYNLQWENFFQTPRTHSEVVTFGQNILHRYGIY